MEDQQQQQGNNSKKFDHGNVDGFGPEPEKKGGFFGGGLWWVRVAIGLIGLIIYLIIEFTM